MDNEKLILFDIDGTLIKLDDVADRAFRRMTGEVYGVECSFTEVSYSGKTDPQILEEVLLNRGLTRKTIWSKFALASKKYCTYFEHFANENNYTLTIYPGVIPLLDYLAGQKMLHLAILTGNMEFSAWKKLELAGLKKFFSFGAFGSDAKNRSELVGIAISRAQKSYGKVFTNKNVVIIGDSPNDVLCGKPYGVKSIAVATGHHTLEELKSYNPDYFFSDLSELKKIVDAIVW